MRKNAHLVKTFCKNKGKVIQINEQNGRHNVPAEHSVDGHVSILLGKWPVADRYIEFWIAVGILPKTFGLLVQYTI